MTLMTTLMKSIKRQKVVRDSTAPPTSRLKSKPLETTDSTQKIAAPAKLDTETGTAASRSRTKRPVRPPNKPSKKAAGISGAQLEALQDEARTADWLRTRELRPSSGPTAQERIESIRGRILATS